MGDPSSQPEESIHPSRSRGRGERGCVIPLFLRPAVWKGNVRASAAELLSRRHQECGPVVQLKAIQPHPISSAVSRSIFTTLFFPTTFSVSGTFPTELGLLSELKYLD